MVLVVLTLYKFIDLLTAFFLRSSEQISVVAADIIWIGFSILLYWALKNGPATPGTVATEVKFPVKT
jgi:hypothetical protein